MFTAKHFPLVVFVFFFCEATATIIVIDSFCASHSRLTDYPLRGRGCGAEHSLPQPSASSRAASKAVTGKTLLPQ
ncbi:hypothetical protein V5799_020074 [Amblyomma americanum]|uniref:Secreted protein n=1 Tax=Amblyomma americanum TaxID=6943 RepID=A0AAQ4EUV8_AMBAM